MIEILDFGQLAKGVPFASWTAGPRFWRPFRIVYVLRLPKNWARISGSRKCSKICDSPRGYRSEQDPKDFQNPKNNKFRCFSCPNSNSRGLSHIWIQNLTRWDLGTKKSSIFKKIQSCKKKDFHNFFFEIL